MRCSKAVFRSDFAKLLTGIKAFIFDFDGTLIDSVDAHIRSWIIAIEKVLKVRISYDEVYPLIGLSGVDIIKELLGDLGLKHYGEIRRIKDRAYLMMVRSGLVQLFPGVTKLLRVLKLSNYKVALASSTPTHILMHLSQYLGIDNYIDLYVGGDEVRVGKPNPEIFLRAIKLLNLNPKETIIVGDTPYDVKPAKELGSVAVLVNRNLSEVSPKPDYAFPLFHELTEVVLKSLISRWRALH